MSLFLRLCILKVDVEKKYTHVCTFISDCLKYIGGWLKSVAGKIKEYWKIKMAARQHNSIENGGDIIYFVYIRH